MIRRDDHARAATPGGPAVPRFLRGRTDSTGDDAPAEDGIVGRLAEAWSAFRHLYVRTNLFSRGRISWGETDVRLLVNHLLVSSAGGDVRVDPDVAGFLGFGSVDLVVEAPETWVAEETAPWALLSRPSPVALAFTVRVISDATKLLEAAADVRRLRAIVQRRISRAAALCVLDRTPSADRRFYDGLEASHGIPVLRVLDPSTRRAPAP